MSNRERQRRFAAKLKQAGYRRCSLWLPANAVEAVKLAARERGLTFEALMCNLLAQAQGQLAANVRGH